MKKKRNKYRCGQCTVRLAVVESSATGISSKARSLRAQAQLIKTKTETLTIEREQRKTEGHVKSLVYADKPQTLDHLEGNICRVIADIPPQMLEKVNENWTSRLDYIRAIRGSPMPEIIFKIINLYTLQKNICTQKKSSYNHETQQECSLTYRPPPRLVVARCWQQWITEGRVYRRGGSERPRNTNDREDRAIATSAPTTSLASIQRHLPPSRHPVPSRETIRRRLKSRRPLRRLPLTPHHRPCRLDFCRPRAKCDRLETCHLQ
ncbi:hypothetical protein TNCV_949031 [Trichonephila clavipes]|nr:hypothetical protein TNCV_949031 [Trichonephila clavipes]